MKILLKLFKIITESNQVEVDNEKNQIKIVLVPKFIIFAHEDVNTRYGGDKKKFVCHK